MSYISSRSAKASRPIIGTMIGVGMLSLPFAVSQVGFGFGIAALIGVAVLSWVVLQMYADLVLARGGHARFMKVIGRELGGVGTAIATFSYVASIYGALIAYIIFGGQFFRTVVFSFLPLSPLAASLIFFALASGLTAGGTLFVARVQHVLLPVFAVLIFALVALALPHADVQNFLTFTPGKIGASLGVFLFAFQGMSAIPDARDLLSRSHKILPRAVTRASIVVALAYVVFIATVVAVTGAQTTENAVLGLGWNLGRPAMLLASGIALVVTCSAFMNVASSLMGTYIYDFKLRVIPAWLWTTIVPLVIFFLGASDIISVLNVTGGILVSVTSISMLVAYEKARKSSELPSFSLRVPQFVVLLAFGVFAAVILSTLMS